MTGQGDPDPLARQLLQHARLLSALREDLERLAHETTDSYADLLARLDELPPTEAIPHKPLSRRCWRDLDESDRETLMTELTDWVTWLRSRYPLARSLPACWAAHPELIEELTALWLAWVAAYQSDNAAPTAPADWHDRLLPGLLHRLERGPWALACTSNHQERATSAYGPA